MKSFYIENDKLVRYIPHPELGEHVYRTDVIITKEMFIECYEKWIKAQCDCEVKTDEN